MTKTRSHSYIARPAYNMFKWLWWTLIPAAGSTRRADEVLLVCSSLLIATGPVFTAGCLNGQDNSKSYQLIFMKFDE